MPINEHTPERLVLKSGSTTLSLSKEIGKARMQSKLLFWKLKPAEAPLSDIVDVTVDTNVDRASGVDICSTMLVMRTGAGWAFRAPIKRMLNSMPMQFVNLSDYLPQRSGLLDGVIQTQQGTVRTDAAEGSR
ncbi:hypothetical protein [Mesorhizobium sp. WSM2561]|uniref:hypothetical protein n=1 Tax=Mesorhizobium sp. WSM2561 TaxID=1040985 RepID=UPI0012EB5FE6|nr:hypothetical protein [Mesorhizobium sp. WSM2561]